MRQISSWLGQRLQHCSGKWLQQWWDEYFKPRKREVSKDVFIL